LGAQGPESGVLGGQPGMPVPVLTVVLVGVTVPVEVVVVAGVTVPVEVVVATVVVVVVVPGVMVPVLVTVTAVFTVVEPVVGAPPDPPAPPVAPPTVVVHAPASAKQGPRSVMRPRREARWFMTQQRTANAAREKTGPPA
jgi:hypothetical protein